MQTCSVRQDFSLEFMFVVVAPTITPLAVVCPVIPYIAIPYITIPYIVIPYTGCPIIHVLGNAMGNISSMSRQDLQSAFRVRTYRHVRCHDGYLHHNL